MRLTLLRGITYFIELSVYSTHSSETIVCRLLVINPTSRLSGKQCLQHRFIAGYAESNGLEPPGVSPLKIPAQAFDHELVRCELDLLRKEIGVESEFLANCQ
ncbi:hypothetical protein EON65_18240 [archaeon]|nr:MAG: hypothetical protein EON65_18240 [archaeon]